MLRRILLLTSAWAVAQYSSEPNATSQSSAGAGTTTVEGCLSGSEGSYSLTDKSGTIYKLTGHTAKLQAHVGHTMQVTGTTSSGMSGMEKQSGSMSGPAESQPTLAVTSFKHISASCDAMH